MSNFSIISINANKEPTNDPTHTNMCMTLNRGIFRRGKEEKN